MKIRNKKVARKGISIFLSLIFMATMIISDLAPIFVGAEEQINPSPIEMVPIEKVPIEKVKVEGTIVDDNGKPIQDVEVKAVGYSEATVKSTGTGSFSLEVYKGQRYTITASKVGYQVITIFQDVEITEENRVISKPIGLDRNRYTIAIKQPAHGVISRADNGKVVDNIILPHGESVTLSVAPKGGFELKEVKFNGSTATTDENGNFPIAGIKENITVEAFFTDIAAPVFGKVSVSKENDWANEKFITYEVSDNYEVKTVYYSYEAALTAADLERKLGDTVWLAENPIRVTENGTVYIYAVDNADNMASTSVTIAKIDTTAPKLVDMKREETGNKWYQRITFSFKVEETESGIDKVYYSSREDGSRGTDITEKDGLYSFKVSENKKWYIFVVDKAGNKTIATETTENIDTEAPKISGVQASKEWDAEKNIVTFQVTDNNKLAKVYYSAIDEYVEGSESLIELKGSNGRYSFEVKQSGKYYIFAVDEAGNLGRASVEVDHIDDTAPVVKKVEKNKEEEWNNGGVIIYITAEDSQSGISKVFYSSKYESYEEAQRKKELFEAIEEKGRYKILVPEEEFNGKYSIWAVDSVGRISEISSIEIKIDRTAPSDLKLTYVEDKEKGFIKEFLNIITFGLLFKDKIHITMEAKDAREKLDSGLAYYEYQMVPEGAELSEDKWVKVKSTEDKVEVSIPYEPFIGRIYFRAWDRAGNSAEAVTDKDGTTVIIDDETSIFAPSVDTNGYEEGQWTNRPVVISLKGGATLSGVDYYEYRIDYADPDKEDSLWTKAPETDGELPHMDGGTIFNQITLEDDFNGKLFFRAVANNMNISAETSGTEVKLQKSLPANGRLHIKEPNGTNGWYVEGYPSIRIEEPVIDEYSAPVRTYYKLWSEGKGEREEAVDAVLLEEENQPVISEDGIYNLKLWTVDISGNHTSEGSVIIKEIKVDITAPDKLDMVVQDKSILAKEKDSISYSLFYDKEINVMMAADADISGLKALTYQKVKSPKDFDAEKGQWLAYDSEEGLSITPNDKFIIYLKAEDMAGNTTIVNSDGIIVDNKPPTDEKYSPEITINPEGANKNGYYSKDVKVQLAAIDPKYLGDSPDSKNGFYSGLAELSYRILSEDKVTKEELLLLEGDGSQVIKDEDGLIQSWKGAIVIDSEENNSNRVIVEVTAVDKAGNITITRSPVGAIKIDTTAPRIDVSYNNNDGDSGSFFREDRTATITVTERNFDSKDMVIKVTNSDGVIPSVATWEEISGTGNGDNTLHRGNLTFSADGDYTFEIEYTDLADNKAGAVNYSPGTMHPEEFSIDKTLPKVSVTYDNNSVRNGRYFNRERTATITVEEHNFTPDRASYTVTAMRDGASIAPPALSGWSRNGDIYTAKLTFSQDGDYTFDFRLSDMAGNEDQGVNYGSSAAAEAFVVDTTIEAPIIRGVENGNAYKGEVNPETEVSDINFQGYRLQLLRTRRGEINVDVTKEFIRELSTSPQGASGVHDTFEEIKENDGIYTLTLSVMDKAGNEESTTATFSVNRFGSVYVYNNYLAGLQDDYVQKVEESLVITEFNADKLLEGSVRVEITLDGKPIENPAYEVSPVVNSAVEVGNSGWYQYDYSIAFSNFERDGIYKVVVSSEDEAGNKPENINYEEGEILFRVDTTSPEISNITGLDSKYHNAENIDVSFDLFDSIGLKEAKVYVSGKEAAVFNEFESLTDFTGTFKVGEGMNQEIRIVVEDLAGNITDTAEKGFSPKFPFENDITVSTNVLIRWYANKPLFGSSIAGALALGAGGTVFTLKRKGKLIKDDKAVK